MTEHRSHRTLASFDDAVRFHGHACPGLALGYRVAVAAMRRLDVSRAEDDLLRITGVQEPPPSKARIHASSRCALCGERMMETRARNGAGASLCIPCAEKTRPSS